MGTRHLTAVVVDGEYKIAQYGQWDGYPSGQGATILTFLQTSVLDVFREKCRRLSFKDEATIGAAWRECGATDLDWISMEVADQMDKKYPEASRNTGAKVLGVVLRSQEPEKLLVKDMLEFAQNGLLCEWAYVLDLDGEMLEVYSGFHKEPVLEGRFAAPVNEAGYGPVQLLHAFSFAELKDMTVEEFCNVLEPLEGDDNSDN